MSVEVPLGSPLYLRIWHDNSGQKGKASWFLNMVNIMDLQTGEKYFAVISDVSAPLSLCSLRLETTSSATIGWRWRKETVWSTVSCLWLLRKS